MSMKRSKQRTYGRRSGDDAVSFSFGGKKAEEPEKSWEDQVTGQPEEVFAPYSLQGTFSKGALIAHPKFGKGVVLGVEGPRMDVLFQEGKKKLGHRGT
jgi:hypothetical protein